MRRRSFVGAAAATTATTLAGCSALGLGDEAGPATVDDPPAAIYRPGHVDGMAMAGTGEAGAYRFGLTYTVPHRFWQVSGTDASLTGVRDADDVHLMCVVWDAETGTVLPQASLTATIRTGGELVAQEVVYPMLSQRMGFHYGKNFGLAGDGDYAVTVGVDGVSSRLTGSFRDRLADPDSTEIAWSFAASDLDDLTFTSVEDAGDPGAVSPMDMEMLPNNVAPDALPGSPLGEGGLDDVAFVGRALDDPPAGAGEGGGYLAVSARTRYNRMQVPMMGLSATVARDGETVFDGALAPTLDPELSYHYGAAVDVREGDDVALEVTTPSQVARHAGYETAMLSTGTTELSR